MIHLWCIFRLWTWIIPCQFTQIWHEDWHDRLGFSWNFVHFPMRHVKTRNILILGQVLFGIWVGEFWPDPLDLEPLSIHISACILPRKMIFISFFSFLKALHGQPGLNHFKIFNLKLSSNLTGLTLTIGSHHFFKIIEISPFGVISHINILRKKQSGISNSFWSSTVYLGRGYVQKCFKSSIFTNTL